jgi:hypothetical protein
MAEPFLSLWWKLRELRVPRMDSSRPLDGNPQTDFLCFWKMLEAEIERCLWRGQEYGQTGRIGGLT